MKKTKLTYLFFTICVIGLMLIATLFTNQTNARSTQATTAKNSIYLPFIGNNYFAPQGTPIFGLQMYQDSRSSSPYHSYLTGSQASWLRIAVAWSLVEPTNTTPENFVWAAADVPLAAAREDMGELNIVATVLTAPEWAADTPEGPIDPEHMVDFADFMSAIVERYDGDGVDDAPGSPVITHWELYNEPDGNSNPGFLRWGHDGEKYAQMLSIVYPAIKAANPNAQVVMGGLAFDWFEDQGGPFVREFLDVVLANGGGQYFDLMNFHSYPAFNTTWADHGPGLKEKAAFIKAKMAAYNVEKPIIVTEAGWQSGNSPNFPSSDEIQSRYVVQLFTQSFAADIPIMIWWMLYDPGDYYPDYGLVTKAPSSSSKPSFLTYQTIVAELDTAKYMRQLTTAETGNERVEAYQFLDGINQRFIYVSWLNPIDTNETHTLKLAGTHAVLRDIYGSPTSIYDSSDGYVDGVISVPITGQPVYVEIQQ